MDDAPGNKAQQGLHGRTELKSIQALRASSFSCGMDCPYQSWSYPYFDTDPFNPYPDPYLQDARETTLHDNFRDTYGNVSNNSMTTGSMDPSSIDDTSILSMTSMNSDLTLRMDTGNPGATDLHYYFTNNYTYISSTDDGNPDACTVQPEGSQSGGTVIVSTPDHVKVVLDQQGFPSQCPSTGVALRQMQMQVVNASGTNVTTPLYSVAEVYNNLSANSCGNGSSMPSSCAALDADGTFLDTLSVTKNFCGSGINRASSCGFTQTSVWSVCSNGLTKSLWNSPRTTHSDNIIVNSNGTTFPAGTQLH